jgi:hypothetical protein
MSRTFSPSSLVQLPRLGASSPIALGASLFTAADGADLSQAAGDALREAPRTRRSCMVTNLERLEREAAGQWWRAQPDTADTAELIGSHRRARVARSTCSV